MSPERWRQVEEMYQSTMDREPEARAAWLAEACEADAELRQEVESLLKLNSTPVMVDQPAWQAAGELLDNDSSMAVGAQLGPYRIEGVLGAGGMGQVYRARDTRLDRSVAIKVSREEFGERFEREARAVAALNHPNICTLHDVGPNYLVMELVEGPTLAERIRQGPIPLAEALAIARQIADALDIAHETGIVHRDLKPGNIKIKPDGMVKVLDFGLAKRKPVQSESDKKPEDSPTISMAATRDGMILGTAAYMSPEQARGQAVDKRSDIWAFGVVLYEMLTGRQLFEGATVTDTLAAVLTKEPDWRGVPTQTRRLLRRCLEKDPKRRLRDVADAWQLLEEPPAEVPGRRQQSKLAWALAAILAIIAVTAIAAWWRATRPLDKPLVRLDVDLGSDVRLGGAYPEVEVILSPDGSRIVFVSESRLFTRLLAQPKAVELTGTEGVNAPFFSPDGQWIGFFAGGQMKKISVEGGTPVALCPSGDSSNASWGDDGNIIAALSTLVALSRVSSNGGVPTPVTVLDEKHGERTHRWPQVLPRSKAVLFTSHTNRVGFDAANIEVMTFADHHRKTLQRGATFGRYLPSGHLVYVSKGTLFAVRFDPDRLELLGSPKPVLTPVAYATIGGQAQFDFSRNGTVVYRSAGGEGARSSVQWIDSSGRSQPFLRVPGEYSNPKLSPDGGRLALIVTNGQDQDVWVYDSHRETGLRLTFDGSSKSHPLWTADGRYIIYGGGRDMFWVRSDGATKQPQGLMTSEFLRSPFSLTADGRRVALQHRVFGAVQADIWTVPLETKGDGLQAGQPEPFLQSPFNERAPAISPDGKWLAYESNESGRSQVYVRSFPQAGGKHQVSTEGGQIPTWSRTGRELFFRNEDSSRIMVASYTVKGDTFTAENPRLWLERTFASPRTGRNFDLAPDGKRMVALIPVEPKEEQISNHHVIFLENFFDELRRRTERQ